MESLALCMYKFRHTANQNYISEIHCIKISPSKKLKNFFHTVYMYLCGILPTLLFNSTILYRDYTMLQYRYRNFLYSTEDKSGTIFAVYFFTDHQVEYIVHSFLKPLFRFEDKILNSAILCTKIYIPQKLVYTVQHFSCITHHK